MRKLLSDGSNSYWHIAVGVFAGFNPIVAPFFLAFQLQDGSGGEDTPADIAEFMIPFLTTAFFLK